MDADVKWCDIDLFSDELCSCIASRFISLISSSFFVQMSQILSSRKLLPFLASCCHQLSIDDDHTEDIECDDIEEQCREVKTILMMMLENQNVNFVDNFDDGLIKISS